MSTGSVLKAFSKAFVTTTTTTKSPLISSTFQYGGFASCTCSSASPKRYYSSHPSPYSTPSSPSSSSSSTPSPAPRRKRTILDLHNLKRKQVPITVLTAHDYSSGRFIESTSSLPPSSASPSPRGIDICLVGDSLAMVACGYTSTVQLTLDELLYHCRAVARGCSTSLLVADMPFGSYTVSKEECLRNAVKIVQEGNMDGVKLEGGEEIAALVKALSEVGIPVLGHVGLTPQRQAALSGYRVQGKTTLSALKVYHDALAIQEAGAFAIVLEAVPDRLAAFISEKLSIPTIGIGAGKNCDGQVLVQLDMLGVNSLGKGPKFLKRFENWEEKAVGAIGRYVEEVREGKFPEDKHAYPIDDQEWEGFLEVVEKKERK